MQKHDRKSNLSLNEINIMGANDQLIQFSELLISERLHLEEMIDRVFTVMDINEMKSFCEAEQNQRFVIVRLEECCAIGYRVFYRLLKYAECKKTTTQDLIDLSSKVNYCLKHYKKEILNYFDYVLESYHMFFAEEDLIVLKWWKNKINSINVPTL